MLTRAGFVWLTLWLTSAALCRHAAPRRLRPRPSWKPNRAHSSAPARPSSACRRWRCEDARSNATLGRLRQGSGVVIGPDELVLTIGYLVLEADQVQLVLDDERSVPARVVGYDLATGFGLLQPLAPLRIMPAPLGGSRAVSTDEPLLVASGGDSGQLSMARLVSRRSFAGYWEYRIDDALFTAPPRTDHSGAGLFNSRGELVGIGSLSWPRHACSNPAMARGCPATCSCRPTCCADPGRVAHARHVQRQPPRLAGRELRRAGRRAARRAHRRRQPGRGRRPAA